MLYSCPSCVQLCRGASFQTLACSFKNALLQMDKNEGQEFLKFQKTGAEQNRYVKDSRLAGTILRDKQSTCAPVGARSEGGFYALDALDTFGNLVD